MIWQTDNAPQDGRLIVILLDGAPDFPRSAVVSWSKIRGGCWMDQLHGHWYAADLPRFWAPLPEGLLP